MSNNENIKQLSILKIILYHLLPGVLILLFTIFFANPVWGPGVPILLALMFAIMFGLVPVQLSIIFFTGKRQGIPFKEALSFTEKTPLRKLIPWAALCFLLGGMMFAVFSGIEYSLLWENFSLMPDWLRLDKHVMAAYSVNMFRITVALCFVFNCFLGPITEELYFRGFLLPRMNRLGRLAPLVNTVLFSLYHFFSPWEFFTRILGVLPLAYTVWFKKDIRIGMAVHCSLNLTGSLSMIALALQM